VGLSRGKAGIVVLDANAAAKFFGRARDLPKSAPDKETKIR
jgi:hypothetical protein